MKDLSVATGQSGDKFPLTLIRRYARLDIDINMFAIIRNFLLFSVLASSAAYASPTVHVRQIGDNVAGRASTSNRIELIQAGRMAIVYDQEQGRRRRLITGDGKITSFKNKIPGNTLFDEYIWNNAENRLYLLAGGGSLSKLNLNQREFSPLMRQPKFLRDAEYVSRWGAVVASGQDGLYLAEGENLRRILTHGPKLNDVVRVKDLPKYHSLLLETIEKQVFLLTSDYVLHDLGKIPGDHDTIEDIAELKNTSAIQILGSRSALHINMSKGPDSVWRPSNFKWYEIDMSYGRNGFVPQLDAMVVKSSSLFDWFFDRSGLYKLTSMGLSPIGNWKDQTGEYWEISNLPAAGISLYRPFRGFDGKKTLFRLDGNGDLTLERRLAPLGPYFNVFQIDATNKLIATTNTGAWLWDGRNLPTRLNNVPWSHGQSLPLTKEVLLHSNASAILVDRSGHSIALPVYKGGGGQVLQITPDCWIEFGRSIIEVSVKR